MTSKVYPCVHWEWGQKGADLSLWPLDLLWVWLFGGSAHSFWPCRCWLLESLGRSGVEGPASKALSWGTPGCPLEKGEECVGPASGRWQSGEPLHGLSSSSYEPHREGAGSPWRDRIGVIRAGDHFSTKSMGWGVRQIWTQKPVSPGP